MHPHRLSTSGRGFDGSRRSIAAPSAADHSGTCSAARMPLGSACKQHETSTPCPSFHWRGGSRERKSPKTTTSRRCRRALHPVITATANPSFSSPGIPTLYPNPFNTTTPINKSTSRPTSKVNPMLTTAMSSFFCMDLIVECADLDMDFFGLNRCASL